MEQVAKNNFLRLYFWNSQYDGQQFQIKGEFVSVIKPIIEMNPPAEMTVFSFERSLLVDMGIMLGEAPASAVQADATTNQVRVSCKLCQKGMPFKSMREHIAEHILKEDLVDVCGFCGSNECSSSLVHKKSWQAAFQGEQ